MSMDENTVAPPSAPNMVSCFGNGYAPGYSAVFTRRRSTAARGILGFHTTKQEKMGHDNTIPRAPDHTVSFCRTRTPAPSISTSPALTFLNSPKSRTIPNPANRDLSCIPTPLTKAMPYNMRCNTVFTVLVSLQDWTPEKAGSAGRLDGVVFDQSRSPGLVFVFLATLPLSCLFDRFEDVGEDRSIGFGKYKAAP